MFLWKQQHWVLLLENLCMHTLRAERNTDTQAPATSGVGGPQNRAPTPTGLFNLPSISKGISCSVLCQESPRSWEHPFPQPCSPTAPRVPLQLQSCHYWVPDRPPAPTKLITSSGQSFQQRAENSIGLEKEKWELVGLQRLDGFVRLGAKSGFLLGMEERRSTFPTLILAPSGKAVMGLEENALLVKFAAASVKIPLGSLEACYRDLIQ